MPGSGITPGSAILRINSMGSVFDFLLPEELGGVYSYTNEWKFTKPLRTGNKLVNYRMWNGGSDESVSLELKLVVGASYRIDTPEQLMDTVTKLMAVFQPSARSEPPQDPPATLRIQIGRWFIRECFPLSCKVTFGRPYDPETSLPYVATISLSLQYVYELTNLPNRDTFAFDRS